MISMYRFPEDKSLGREDGRRKDEPGPPSGKSGEGTMREPISAHVTFLKPAFSSTISSSTRYFVLNLASTAWQQLGRRDANILERRVGGKKCLRPNSLNVGFAHGQF